ncbi:uncharacterized protein PV09_08778 [Verruconis gallopava]|uniref:Amidase domain-containing protein n=1 Tax=Verruconis gallopava TaxID=253628 RepID=A0A0D2AKR7_9PEZI|nr:uncharacterized protein PV09_08778 [Verruconis gallopava]KIV99603.1 hypothetical protein PV09_08778 [Verruconis gallopava]
MSVFSVTPKDGNPVTTEVLDATCKSLGVLIHDDEKEDYRKLLAVFHEAAEELMAMPDFDPPTNVKKFPREQVHFPTEDQNPYGAWAWKCSIRDPNIADGPLSGKRIAVKDNIAVKDVPMLLGTNFIKNYTPKIDATVVTRVLEAGGEIVGKAVCENMCHSATSHSAATGIVENPRAKGYSSGGSSSGCGVLVSLGEVDMAIGADQGGSVRIPACNCGIVGFKPTFGLIPYTGCGSNEASNDHLGPMTKTVMDCATLLSVIAGQDGIDDRGFAAPTAQQLPQFAEKLKKLSSPDRLDGLKVGVIVESLSTPVLDPRVRNTFCNAANRLREIGASVEDVGIPIHKKGTAIWTGVSKVGGYLTKLHGSVGRRSYNMTDLNALMHPITQANWDGAYVSTKNIYLNGAYAMTAFPHLLAKSINLSRMLRAAYDEALKKYDVLITPTLPYLATPHAKTDGTPLEQIGTQVGLTSNTCQFNQTGHPALTLPCGLLEIENGPLAGTGTKLPVGLQIIGKWWDEETVLRVAHAFEITNDWEKL